MCRITCRLAIAYSLSLTGISLAFLATVWIFVSRCQNAATHRVNDHSIQSMCDWNAAANNTQIEFSNTTQMNASVQHVRILIQDAEYYSNFQTYAATAIILALLSGVLVFSNACVHFHPVPCRQVKLLQGPPPSAVAFYCISYLIGISALVAGVALALSFPYAPRLYAEYEANHIDLVEPTLENSHTWDIAPMNVSRVYEGIQLAMSLRDIQIQHNETLTVTAVTLLIVYAMCAMYGLMILIILNCPKCRLGNSLSYEKLELPVVAPEEAPE